MLSALRNGLLAAALLLGSGCGVAGVLGFDDDPAVLAGDSAPIQTDSAVYHVRTANQAHELTIGVTFLNRSGKTAYIPTCRTPHPPVLQKWVDGRWVTAFSPVVLQCLGPPVVIAAGATYEYEYHVYATTRPNSGPSFQVTEIPGTYRLVWHILGSWTPDGPEPGLGVELPLELRISNTFRIER